MKNFNTKEITGAVLNENSVVRLLADGICISNDTTQTHLNNNDLIIGPPGSGKTRNYCKPNIMQAEESMIITDTKGVLYGEMAEYLTKAGYIVECLDFDDVSHSCGYNPFEYIRRSSDGKFNERDVLTMAATLVPVKNQKDPYWERSSQVLLQSIISFLLEFAEEEDCTVQGMMRLFRETSMDTGNPPMGVKTHYHQIMEKLEKEHPNCFVAKQFRMMDCAAERTFSCVRSICASHLAGFDFDGIEHMTEEQNSIDLRDFGRRKHALFVNVSDTDRSLDPLINLFYAQAIHLLCYEADHTYVTHRLPRAVRFYFDDFAANTLIPDFDKLISVIRSRNIAFSIVLQSISQLEQLYGAPAATTILNGCDTLIYLGGQDVQTGDLIARKANRPLGEILAMPLDKEYLFVRGQKPVMTAKCDIRKHPKYAYIHEVNLENTEAEEILREGGLPFYTGDPAVDGIEDTKWNWVPKKKEVPLPEGEEHPFE